MADTSLTATYTTQRRTADRDELLRWREETLAEPPPPAPAAAPTPAAPPDPAAAARKNLKEGGSVGRAATAAGAAWWDTFQAGAQNVADAIYAKAPQSVGTKVGQGTLGALGLFGSLGAGLGGFVRSAIKDFTPGMEGAVAIPGGGAAGRLRTAIAVPGLLMDPKMKDVDPRALLQGLEEPVTYGELIDLAIQVIAPVGLGVKFAGQVLKPRGAPAAAGAAPAPAVAPVPTTLRAPDASMTQMAGGAPTQAAPAAPTPLPRTMSELMAQKGVPAAAPAAELGPAPAGPTTGTPPRTMADLMAEAGVPGAKAGAEASPMTSADVAMALRADWERRPYESAPAMIEGVSRTAEGGLVDPQGRPVDVPPAVVDALVERDRLRAFERTPLDAPARTAKPEGFGQEPSGIPDVSAPVGDLGSALDVAIQKTGGAFKEAFDDWGFGEDPIARPIAGGAPAPAEVSPRAAVIDTLGHMWSDLKEAAPGERFLITDDVGKVEGGLRQPSTYPEWMNALTTRRTRAEADKLMQAIDNVLDGKNLDGAMEQAVQQFAEQNAARFSQERGGGLSSLMDEAGRVPAGLLARMAIGAVAGGAAGETPEERIIGAFAGMGLGAAVSKRLAARVAAIYKESGLADERGSLDFSKFRPRPAVQATEQPFQPNYKRLALTPELKRFSVNLHRMMKDEILERRGGVKTEEATVTAAKELLSEGKMTAERLLNLEDAAVLSREEITAARMIGQRSRDYSAKLNDAFKAGQVSGEEFMDAFAVAAAISKNVRVAQTRIAQAQQASHIKVGVEHPSAYRPDDVIHLADDLAKNATPEQLSKALDAIETPATRQKVTELAAIVPRAFIELMHFMYLSGEATIKNGISFLLMPPLGMTHAALAPYMPRWGKAAQAERTLPGSAAQMYTAYQETMLDMVHMLKFWDPEQRARLRGLEEAVGGGRQVEDPRYAPAFTSENMPAFGPAADVLGAIFRIPRHILGTTDAMAKMVHARMWQRFEAYHQASREGHVGEDLGPRIDTLMNDATQLSDLARERIQDYRERMTFTNDLEGVVTGAFQRGPENPWLQAAYSWQFFPYRRTPLRLTETAMLEVPGINLLTTTFYKDMAAGGRAQQMAQAKVALGSVLLGAFGYMESAGWLTGDGPDDPALRKQWQDELGWQPRSAWDVVAKKWRSYNGIQPVSDWIAAGADMSAAARRTGGDLGSMGLAGALAIVQAFDTKAYMQTLSDWLSFMRPGTSSDTAYERFIALQAKRIQGALNPGFLREIETGVDPEVRRARPSGAYDNVWSRELDVLKRNWMSQIPGLSSLKDAEGFYVTPPDRDRIDGAPTMIETAPFVPFAARTPKDDPLKRHIFGDLKGAGLGPWPEWLGGGQPTADIGIGTREAENVTTGARMTPQEKDIYVRLLTQEVKDGQGQTYRQALEAAVANPLYQAQSDFGPSGTPRDSGKARWLQRIDREFHKQTETALRAKAPALDREINRKEQERKVRSVPTAQQPGVREMLQGLTR